LKSGLKPKSPMHTPYLRETGRYQHASAADTVPFFCRIFNVIGEESIVELKQYSNPSLTGIEKIQYYQLFYGNQQAVFAG